MANNFIEEIIEKDLAEGKVDGIQTRFPPEPNGYLHIGHAKGLTINFSMAQKYNGKCYLRYDDTNPVKEDTEYVKSIEQDIAWLGFKWCDIVFASSYFDRIYELAVKLIKDGKAFVCDLTPEQMHEYRGTLTEPGKESPYRNRSVEENLDLFIRMRNGEFADGEKVLRAKIDMASPNINMRDPVIYRILHTSHHKTGNKWCIYPMYDFAHPLEDAIEGTTHSLCSLEFENHRPLYDWVVRECGFIHKPQQIEFARLNITNTVLSKRYLLQLVTSKSVDGWDDPRMPTLCGMRRKGYPAVAIVDFLNRVGVSKSNSEVEQTYLDSVVREHLNISADRVMAVANPIKIELTNYDGTEMLDVENNPNATEITTRKVSFGKNIYIDGSDFALVPPPKYHRLKPDGYVRLKGAYIIHCDEIITDSEGKPTLLKCSVVPNSKSGNDNSGIKVKGVIQWVNVDDCVALEMRHFDNLLDGSKTEGDFSERINEQSLTKTYGYGEKRLATCQVGDTFQFMRLGYYCYDKDSTAERLVFNETAGLKDNFNK